MKDKRINKYICMAAYFAVYSAMLPSKPDHNIRREEEHDEKHFKKNNCFDCGCYDMYVGCCLMRGQGEGKDSSDG